MGKPKPKRASKTKAEPAAPKLMRIRAYARSVGVSAPTIVGAIRAGKITPAAHDHRGPLIDPAEAERTWNSRRGKKRGAMQLVGIPREPDDPENMSPDEAAAREVRTADGVVVPTFFQSKTLKEHFASRMAELRFAEAEGKLVDADKVKRDAYTLGRKARDRLLAIADRVSPIVAAETDPNKVHAVLSRELSEVCREIATASPVELDE